MCMHFVVSHVMCECMYWDVHYVCICIVSCCTPDVGVCIMFCFTLGVGVCVVCQT